MGFANNQASQIVEPSLLNPNPSKQLDCLIEPLRSHFNIDFITYARYKHDSVELFSSDLEDLESFLNDKDSVFPIDIADSTTILDWNSYCSAAFLKRCQQEFNYNPNGVVVFLHHGDFAEHVSIGTSDMCLDLGKVLRENASLKRQIVSHVRSHINLLKADHQSIVRHRSHMFSDNTDGAITSRDDTITPSKRLYIYGNLGQTYLTQSEVQCFLLYLQMRSAKEIANYYCLSTKTVEVHLSNLKRKCGAKTKHELFSIAVNNQLI